MVLILILILILTKATKQPTRLGRLCLGVCACTQGTPKQTGTLLRLRLLRRGTKKPPSRGRGLLGLVQIAKEAGRLGWL